MSYSPLSPQYTEAVIKQVLDGTFTRVTYENRVVTDNVSDDFMPKYSGQGRPIGYKAAKPQVAWTPHEDEILLTMRLRNKPFAEIAWTIDRSEESAKKRYRTLRVNGKVMV